MANKPERQRSLQTWSDNQNRGDCPLPPQDGSPQDDRNTYPPSQYSVPCYPSYQPSARFDSTSQPRQRTAIACQYCRKRKIRCSVFDSEGRCENCIRCNQHCVFQLVSSQAIFVLASAFYSLQASAQPVQDSQDRKWSGCTEPPMIYGAHGQPLGYLNTRRPPPRNYPPPRFDYLPHSSGTAPPHRGKVPTPLKPHSGSYSETTPLLQPLHLSSQPQNAYRFPCIPIPNNQESMQSVGQSSTNGNIMNIHNIVSKDPKEA